MYLFVIFCFIMLNNYNLSSADISQTTEFDRWWSCDTIKVQEINVATPIDAWDVRGNSLVYVTKRSDLYHCDFNDAQVAAHYIGIIGMNIQEIALSDDKVLYKGANQGLCIINKNNGKIRSVLKNKSKGEAAILVFVCHPRLPLCASIGSGDRLLRIHDVNTEELKSEIHTVQFLKPQQQSSYFLAWHPEQSLVAIAYMGSLLLYNVDKEILWKKNEFYGIPWFSYSNDWFIGGETNTALLRVSCDPSKEIELIKKDLQRRYVLTGGASCFFTEDNKHKITLCSINGEAEKVIDIFNMHEQGCSRKFPSYHDIRYIAVTGSLVKIYEPCD